MTGRIYDELARFNLGVTPDGARLAYISIQATEPILTPSIEYVWMEDYESTLVIKGLFGEQPEDFKVTVDGISASNITWSPYLITAEIPTEGKGSYGDVIVSVRGNESNKVPLSQWTIPVHVTVDEFGLETDVKLQLKIRADVHKYRTKPGETPRTDRPEAFETANLPGFPGWYVSNASTATYAVTGYRQVSCTKQGCYMRDTESIFNKDGNLPYNPFGSGLGFKALYKWSPDMTTIYVQAFATIPDIGGEMELYSKCDNSPAATTRQSISRPMGFVIPTPGIEKLIIRLNENYDVIDGNVSTTRFVDWGRCEVSSKIKTTATWSGAKNQWPPKNNTDARSDNVASGN